MTIVRAGTVGYTHKGDLPETPSSKATFGHNATPVKGYISVPDYAGMGMPVEYVFLYNPAELAEKKDVNYGDTNVPGASHPVHQFGSGGARQITFDLFLDGDRSKFAFKNKTKKNFTTAEMDEIMSVKSDVLYWQSLLLSMEYGRSEFAKVKPPHVIFNFGDLYQNVTCIVKRADPRWTHFNIRMVPIRATLSVQLDEDIERSVTGPEFYRKNMGTTA